MVKWLYQFAILINKIFYSEGKTDVKFCLPQLEKALREKKKSKSEVLTSFLSLFFLYIYILLHHANVGFTSLRHSKGQYQLLKMTLIYLLDLSRKMEPFASGNHQLFFLTKNFKNQQKMHTYMNEQTNRNKTDPKKQGPHPRTQSH